MIRLSVFVISALLITIGFIGLKTPLIQYAEATPIQFGTELEAIVTLGGPEYYTREGEGVCIELSFGEPEDYNATRWVCTYRVYDPLTNETEEGICEYDNPELTQGVASCKMGNE
ncbi:MAG: hypothetical protein JW939_08590 [Candidatus Thermoplasmatota archaeon]|nr:hypothetical protein [Candidatus Thermoplasmatota archaeon]